LHIRARTLQEERLFTDLSAVICRLKASQSPSEARELTLTLRRMCAAVRASLETHVRAEEAELWPLFSEHFSVAEQQHLVGVIIGRTGAEVLQARAAAEVVVEVAAAAAAAAAAGCCVCGAEQMSGSALVNDGQQLTGPRCCP
jgi:2-hydroxychromene-2-carboxylate isomerase